ncbi:MAG: hypothetical protein IIB56_09700 [Planctomycetes bacterium]|nr:hypothetical protein [Planctomycetota bacterium]
MGRLGYSRHSSEQVVTGKSIVGLHRFYFGASKQLIAAAGTLVKILNDGTGVWTAISAITQTDGKNTFMNTWSAVNKEYISNGTDTPFSWDGTTATRLTAFPADTIMILPYRSRLLFISKTDPGLVRWTTTAFTDNAVITAAAALIRMTEGGQINVITPHALAGQTEGINTWVIVATGSSIALMFSLDFLATGGADQTPTTKLEAVSNHVGIVSPRAVVSTPAGTIFLGSDRQVYLLPFGSFQLIPIGKFITSNTTSNKGIESIGTTDLEGAAATYHNGFYKLAVNLGGANNETQFWLDVVNLFKDDEGGWGPWYGPMIGMPPVAMFTIQNGPNDDARLITGHGASTAFVHRANESSVFSDIEGPGTPYGVGGFGVGGFGGGGAQDIDIQYQTHHQHFMESKGIDVVINQYETEMESLDNPLGLSFRDTTGTVGAILTINTGPPAGTFWDSANWDSFNWVSNREAVRQSDHLPDSNVRGRQLAVSLSYKSSTDRLALFRLRLETSPLQATFQVEN